MDHIRPRSHPLDYDWRFTRSSVNKILEILPSNGAVLSLGVPSIVKSVRQRSQEILLVDRQHIENVENQLNVDVSLLEKIDDKFQHSVVDPPWYIKDTIHWLSLCAASIDVNGKIFLATWPDDIRPDAKLERKQIFDWIETWGLYDVYPSFFQYDTPFFESKSLEILDKTEKKDLREGDLVIIRKLSTPKVLKPLAKTDLWHRFVIGQYQLALKVRENDGIPSINKHHLSSGWTWHSVSKRAEGRDSISLWDSNNKVAKIGGSEEILLAIRSILGLTDNNDCHPTTQKIVIELFNEWEVPSGSSDGVKEWKHQD